MLGCQDFCGHFDWTFHFIQDRFGRSALRTFWAASLGDPTEDPYYRNAQQEGLAGLYRTWVQTGIEEHCDWTWTLSNGERVLRWDMRNCPSKGFLLEHDLHADEDYCDHCMGWIIPLTERLGFEVAAHEHNHCGQCWAEITVAGDRPGAHDSEHDVRHSEAWSNGHIDRWACNIKQPIAPALCNANDPAEVLATWLKVTRRLFTCMTAADVDALPELSADDAVVMTDLAYINAAPLDQGHIAVLVMHDPSLLPEIADRFRLDTRDRQPLLLHPSYPAQPQLAFAAQSLPRPLPLLPLLIRQHAYTHRPGVPPPDAAVLLERITDAQSSLIHSSVK